MPIEIISTIFEFYTAEIRGNLHTTPLTLGAVCQSWRQIAWSTPSIWTSFAFLLKQPENPTRVEVAVEWLQRSRRLPVSIELYTSADLGPQTPVDALLPLIESINLCSDRWRSLSLSVPPLILSHINDNYGAPPVMDSLYINVADSKFIHLSIPSTMSKKVDITGISLEDLSFQWDNTTYVSADGSYTVYDCIEILRQGTHLIKCYFVPMDSGFHDVTFDMCMNHQVTYLNFLCYCEEQDMAFFFDHVTLPALHTLHLNMMMDGVPVQSLTTFI
ncbi:hypothetical protein CPB84DRAFT_1848603 [Gymnopilus junonius]|uniref:F-box domain-containing protein n=1 Tax=Gymnopilus junonius TaxID=109634 RepID=A0A9P5TKM0_GYMJU|nr:hypothetical protein CPB84DRAFT_1848603 [Gymnopilus junonius]